jgi:hypothetical protein
MNNCSTAHTHPSRNTVTVSTPFQHDQKIPFVIRSQAVKLYHYRGSPHKTLEGLGPQILTLRSNVKQNPWFL